MPTVSTPSSQLSRICDSSSIRCAGHAEVARHVDEALRVRRVRRADHEHEVDLARERLDRRLAVGRGVADVVLGRPDDGREARLQRGDDVGRLVDRERRLREVRELLAAAAPAAARRPRRSARARSRRAPRPSCRPPPRGPAWPIRKIVRPWPAKRLRLVVHLGHERAGRVDRAQPAQRGVAVHLGRDAVRREHDRRALRHVLLALDEDRALLLEPPHDVDVVHDLLAHVDRRAVQDEHLLDRLDGALDAGAVPARAREQETAWTGDRGHATSLPATPAASKVARRAWYRGAIVGSGAS